MIKLRMLAPLLLIYFAWRCFLLFFWNPILLFIYAEEELYRGWIGKEILDGLKMSFFTYRADDYSGGSMLIGSIASAFFRVFGENSFSLKLIPVFLFAGALAAWYQWLAKYQSRRLAVFFSLAFIFSPLLFTRFSFTILGDHTETIFFTALTVLLFFNCLAGSRYRFIYAALLGLCAGLATWMAYIYAITVIAMGVYWFLQDRHFFRRPVFRITALFFLIGFSPWIYANLYTGFQGFFLQGTPLSECFHWKFFIKRLLDPRESSLYRLFSVHRLPSPVPEMPPQAVTHFYRVMYAAPVLLAFWKIRGRWRETFQKLTSSRSPLLFSVIYLSAFLLISQATDFRETRYYIPAQPFVFFLALYCVDRGLSSFKKSAAVFGRTLYLGVLILASISLHVYGMRPENRGGLSKISPFLIHWLLLAPACRTPDLCLETYKNFRDKEKLTAAEINYFKSGVAQKLLEEIPFNNPPAELQSLKSKSPAELFPYYDYYFGYEVTARNNYDLKKSFALLQHYHQSFNFDVSLAAFGAFRAPIPRPEGDFPFHDWRAPLTNLPKKAIPFYWQQRGFQWAEYRFAQIHNFQTLIEEAGSITQDLSESEGSYFLQGLGIFAFFDWQLAPYQKHSLWDGLTELPALLPSEILEGAGIGVSTLSDVFSPVYQSNFLEKFSDPQRLSLENGIKFQSRTAEEFLPQPLV